MMQNNNRNQVFWLRFAQCQSPILTDLCGQLVFLQKFLTLFAYMKKKIFHNKINTVNKK
jgi:hypothetical protein